MSTCLTIGLAITNSLHAFETLSFFVGVVTVVPQIVLPLAADLAPPERRASAISIVLSGLLFGILVARVLAGVIANFTTWRVIYFVAIGVQSIVLVGAYLIIPDYPAKNQGLTYFNILTSMAKFAVTEPTLIQASIILLCSSACFSSYWVRLSRASHSYPHLFVSPGYIDISAWRTTLSLLYVRIFRYSHYIRRL
jgi:predicted MFS family arabinose efflux permease